MMDDTAKNSPLDAEGVSVAANGSVTIRLDYPVTHENEPLAEITLRRPTIADLEASTRSRGDIAASMDMVAKLAGLPMPTVGQIDASDWMLIADVLKVFTERRRRTGAA